MSFNRDATAQRPTSCSTQMHMTTEIRVLLLSALVLALGCSSSSKRFEEITPGMTMEDVKKAMNQGPTRFETLAATGSSATPSGYESWYFGDDQCVLFKDQKVVSKDVTRD